LQPKLRRKGATNTHNALLQLARSRDGDLRLVTTNFDRIFEKVSKRNKQSINAFTAPMLPIPKNSRWNGLVYLHGLLPESEGIDDDALNRLVLTSGDFGLAYLTERWAARFVSELFRNYVVCFVGYSINDPVLRYMMDALAADRMLGEITPQAYAFGDYMPGEAEAKTIEWKAKGVVPILYEVSASSHDHSALHYTLKVWAEVYRDGILGKESIVTDYAMARPSASTQQDNFVGRMLWALSHKSGLPAKRFADFDPVPPIEWLDAFSENRYVHSDLVRFDVSPHLEVDEKLQFSLIQRPAPYNQSPWMSLVPWGKSDSQWDVVMFHLARWLVRHLNDPALLIWVAQCGSQLHSQWSSLIEHELDRFTLLEKDRNTSELEEIRSNAPNAIPNSRMSTLWHLLLTGRVKSPWRDVDLYRWKNRLKRDGLTTSLRLELREILAPKISLKKPFHWEGDDEDVDTSNDSKKLVDWELVLAADHVHSSIKDLLKNQRWKDVLPALLDDFQQLLRDALGLLYELGEADERSDCSHWSLPSITPHWQNRGYCDWVTLIELLRDSWLATRESDPKRATIIAQEWFTLPHSTFKRLALFAACHNDCIAADQWVSWLLNDDSWWLWSVDTQRETMRLLVLQGSHLSLEDKTRLEMAILTGPPRSMFRDSLEPENWQSIVERSIWLHLAKLHESGCILGAAASERFKDLSTKNPKWELASNEQDEFSSWMSGTGDPDYEDSREIVIAPRKRQDLVSWLKSPQPERHVFHEDTWREVCQTRFFHSIYALCDLTREGIWPVKRWREALQAWSEEGYTVRSWRFAALLIQTMPSEKIQELVRSLTWWLESVSKTIDEHETVFMDLCLRVLALPHVDIVDADDPVGDAINHPIGHITRALLNIWFKRRPNDNETLPIDLEPFFTQICNIQIEQFRHGRVLLASNLIALFQVDRGWTEEYLLPCFDWNLNSVEAKAAWEGFLWSPRLYPPLLIAFKAQFLDTANHYTELGGHGHQFASFLTYAALDPVGSYTPQDFQLAIAALPNDGLNEVARSLMQALDGAGDQREDYWKNRIQPFWQNIWPKSRELTSNGIAESLARLSIAARGEFPSALSVVLNWLQPIEHPHYVVHQLSGSGLAVSFPQDALSLLNAIIIDQPWCGEELRQCLDAISQAAPVLFNDLRYRRLDEYCRRHEAL